jgi:uncharacterized protein YijF (DUF1287 family)
MVLLGICLQLRVDTGAAEPRGAAITVVEAAREQVGRTVGYDPAYRALTYPGGDVPESTGVCTDVVIRALRRARGIDLQKRVHEDMRLDFGAYPAQWGLRKPDRNIDHRRVPNLQTFFRRQGWALPVRGEAGDYRAGDLVTCVVPPNLPHIMIVSDRKTGAGVPWVIHNIGGGTREEDRLFDFRITGHFRLPGKVRLQEGPAAGDRP